MHKFTNSVTKLDELVYKKKRRTRDSFTDISTAMLQSLGMETDPIINTLRIVSHNTRHVKYLFTNLLTLVRRVKKYDNHSSITGQTL